MHHQQFLGFSSVSSVSHHFVDMPDHLTELTGKHVWEAKQLVRKSLGNAIVTSCVEPGKNVDVQDSDKLPNKPYNHVLHMVVNL